MSRIPSPEPLGAVGLPGPTHLKHRKLMDTQLFIMRYKDVVIHMTAYPIIMMFACRAWVKISQSRVGLSRSLANCAPYGFKFMADFYGYPYRILLSIFIFILGNVCRTRTAPHNPTYPGPRFGQNLTKIGLGWAGSKIRTNWPAR